MKLFKTCNVLYFKHVKLFTDMIARGDYAFKGKIIVSDFPELNRICSVNGIIHVLNINTHHVPAEKIDCVVTDVRNPELEGAIVKNGYGIPVLYLDLQKTQQHMWCGVCCKNYVNDNNHPIGRYCSEKCMNGTMKAEHVKDLGLNNIVSRIIQSEKQEPLVLEFDKSLSDKRTVSNVKKTVDKFQSSMVKDAIRLEYAFKRESYKREMRQPSLRKASLSDKKERKPQTVVDEVVPVTKLCKGLTKKGKQCTNSALGGSSYCGIISHSMGGLTVSSSGLDGSE